MTAHPPLRTLIDLVTQANAGTLCEAAGDDFLYHGTSVYNLLGIMDDGIMFGQGWDGPEGVSTSTNEQVAWQFAGREERFLSKLDSGFERPSGTPSGALMVFSRKKLRAAKIRTRILNLVPGEAEVRIVGDLDSPLDYLVKLSVSDATLAWYDELHRVNGDDDRGWLKLLPQLHSYLRGQS